MRRRALRRRYGRADGAGGMSAQAFADTLAGLLRLQGRQIGIRVGQSWGPKKEDDVYVNFINLPEGIGGAAGGAEAENNRASFWVRGFGAAGAPSSKVQVEMSNSSLYRGESYSRENRVPFRKKTGTPAVVAKYLADWLNRIVADVPPRYTHTRL